jgi:putative polyketide hydroxylase
MHEDACSRFPVLIAGGGSVGLSCALFLARHGISSLLVERHSGLSIHPRARALTVRTMELLREVGLEREVQEAGSVLAKNRYILTVDTLAGDEIQRVIHNRFVIPPSLSPTTLGLCAQDKLEPLLIAALRKYDADLRFGTELVSFEENTSGITATLVEHASGRSKTVQADYLIGTDGARSSIRSRLGIPTQGPAKPLAYQMSIYFRADLSHLVQGREFILCFVHHPGDQGLLVAVNNTDEWIFIFSYEPERGESFTVEQARERVRLAVGLPQLEVEVLSTLPWEVTSRVAEHFQQGRVFLAGDAAHVIAPAGGYGMNIGIEDAHNLAWKLALVIQGTAGSTLLATYEPERHPHAQGIAQQAELRGIEVINKNAYYKVDERNELWVDDLLLMLGYKYRSQVVVLDLQLPDATGKAGQGSASVEGNPSPFLESLNQLGSPGTRAPHIWLEQQGKRISSLDLFGLHFVLLCGEDGEAWREAAHAVARHFGLTLESYRVGPTGHILDPGEYWYATYGITPAGATLIRPDGFVAWRSANMVQSPHEVLENVLAQLLDRACSSNWSTHT